MSDINSELCYHYNIQLDDDYSTNIQETWSMAPIGIFSKRYSSSRNYIADLSHIGPILISIKLQDDFTYTLTRSSLGFIEYKFNNSFLKKDYEGHAFLLTLYRYFSDMVQGWDLGLKNKKKKTYFDFFGLFNFKQTYPLSADVNSKPESKDMLEYLSIQVLSNIHDFMIPSIIEDFAEINFFYAEEVDNFIYRRGIHVKVEDEIYESLFPKLKNSKHMISSYDDSFNCTDSPLLSYKVTYEEYDSTEITQKLHEKGMLTSIEEFITTEIDYFSSIHTFYQHCQKVRNTYESISPQIYNVIFKSYDKVYGFVRIFVKDLFTRFKSIISIEDIKDKDLVEFLSNSCAEGTDNNERDSFNKQTVYSDGNLLERFVCCLYENSFGLIDYSNFLLSYEISLEKLNSFSLKNKDIFNKTLVSEAFGHVSQRLFRYSLLFKSILRYADAGTESYKDLKILYIRMNNFLKCIDRRKEEQDNLLYKIRISSILKLDILDNNEAFVDQLDCKDVYGDEYTLFLFSNSTIISLRNGPPSSLAKSTCQYKYLETLCNKDIEMQVRGEKGIYIISSKMKDLNYHYKEDYKNCSIFVLYYISYSGSSRKRFINNFKREELKFSFKNINISKGSIDVNLTCNGKSKDDLELSDENERWTIKKGNLIVKTTNREKENLCRIIEFIYYLGDMYINRAILSIHLFGCKNKPFKKQEVNLSALEESKGDTKVYIDLKKSYSTREALPDVFKIYHERVYLKYKFILSEIIRVNEDLERIRVDRFHEFRDFFENDIKTMEDLLENIVFGKEYDNIFYEIFRIKATNLEIDTPRILDFIVRNIYCYFLHDDIEVLYKSIFLHKKTEDLRIISRTRVFKHLLEYFKTIKSVKVVKDFLKIMFQTFPVSEEEFSEFLERLKNSK